MRLHGLILAILLALTALVAPTLVRALTIDGQAQLDLWIVTLDRIEQDIAAGDIEERKITALEQELRALQEAARSLRNASDKQLAPLRREQEAFGILPSATEATPEEGVEPQPAPQTSPLSEGAEQRRVELEARVTEVEGRIRQIDLVLTRAQALLRQLAELSSRQTAERLLSRGPSIFDASTWATARSEFAGFGRLLIQKLEDWWARSRPARIGWAPWLVATFVALVALAATIYGRRWLHRRYGYDPSIEQPSYARTVVAATVEALTGGLGPTLALLAFGSTMITLNVATPRTAPIPFAAGIGLIFYFIASNVVRAVFSPNLPKWRLAPLSAEKSERIGRLLHVLAV